MGNFGSEEETPNVKNIIEKSIDSEKDRRNMAHERLGLPKSSSDGLLTEGNIDLKNRKIIKNPDKSESTVRTITVEFDGKTILLPTVIDGKIVSNNEAVEHYKKTGEHMGIFKDEKSANEYDKKIHQELGWTGSKNKWVATD